MRFALSFALCALWMAASFQGDVPTRADKGLPCGREGWWGTVHPSWQELPLSIAVSAVLGRA